MPTRLPADSDAVFDRDVCDEIARLLRLQPERVIASASLADELGVDSLLYMTMVVGLEQYFDVTLPDQDAARFIRVSDVIDAFRIHVGARR